MTQDGSRFPVFERVGSDLRLPQVGQQVSIADRMASMPLLDTLLPDDSPLPEHVREVRGALCRFKYFAFEEPETEGSVVVGKYYETWLSEARPRKSVLMRLFHLWATDRDRFEEVASILGPDGLGIVQKVRVKPFDPRGGTTDPDGREVLHTISYAVGVGSHAEPRYWAIDELSSGTQRIMRILVSVLFDRPSVMMLEHPEDGIHADLVHKLIHALSAYSEQTQFVISSHSPDVFNAVDASAVRLVTMEDGVTKARALDEAEVHAAERFLAEEGPFSEFLETVEDGS